MKGRYVIIILFCCIGSFPVKEIYSQTGRDAPEANSPVTEAQENSVNRDNSGQQGGVISPSKTKEDEGNPGTEGSSATENDRIEKKEKEKETGGPGSDDSSREKPDTIAPSEAKEPAEEKAVKPRREEPSDERAVDKSEEEKEALNKEKGKAEKEKSKEKKKDEEREYVSIFAGYGGYFPVGYYSNYFDNWHHFSGTVGVYAANLWGISPEVHFRYTEITGGTSTTAKAMKIPCLAVGLVYRYKFRLPELFKKKAPLIVYARIWDGITRVDYTHRDFLMPLASMSVVEYINTFGVNVGVYYPFVNRVIAGLDFGYSYIATAKHPLQGLSVSFFTGVRI